MFPLFIACAIAAGSWWDNGGQHHENTTSPMPWEDQSHHKTIVYSIGSLSHDIALYVAAAIEAGDNPDGHSNGRIKQWPTVPLFLSVYNFYLWMVALLWV